MGDMPHFESQYGNLSQPRFNCTRRFGIRKLTPMECLAFQGFPKNYAFKGISLESAYKQCDNTVFVPIVHSIANNIASQYKGDVKNAGFD